MDTYVATERESKKKESLGGSDRKLVISDFAYDEDSNCFICPTDEELTFRSERKDGRFFYQADREVCQNFNN